MRLKCKKACRTSVTSEQPLFKAVRGVILNRHGEFYTDDDNAPVPENEVITCCWCDGPTVEDLMPPILDYTVEIEFMDETNGLSVTGKIVQQVTEPTTGEAKETALRRAANQIQWQEVVATRVWLTGEEPEKNPDHKEGT
jgi:hypothetical protein